MASSNGSSGRGSSSSSSQKQQQPPAAVAPRQGSQRVGHAVVGSNCTCIRSRRGQAGESAFALCIGGQGRDLPGGLNRRRVCIKLPAQCPHPKHHHLGSLHAQNYYSSSPGRGPGSLPGRRGLPRRPRTAPSAPSLPGRTQHTRRDPGCLPGPGCPDRGGSGTAPPGRRVGRGRGRGCGGGRCAHWQGVCMCMGVERQVPRVQKARRCSPASDLKGTVAAAGRAAIRDPKLNIGEIWMPHHHHIIQYAAHGCRHRAFRTATLWRSAITGHPGQGPALSTDV